MRIALAHPYLWPEVRRGAERYLEDLSAYLAGCGHEVTILTGSVDGPSSFRRDDGTTVLRLAQLGTGPASRLGLTEADTFGARAWTEIKSLRPQVLHAFTPGGALAGHFARVRTLYTVLGHPNSAQLPVQTVPRALFVRASRLATVTATLSRASSKALLETVGRDARVLTPGVSLSRFRPRLDARTGAPRILFSASVGDRRKRADLAVSTLALLLERHPGARLWLSGEGDPRWALDLARKAGPRVEAAIDVLGPGRPSEVPTRYREASVTLPAEHEAFGLALVESLACGTPAVCTPSGGMPEIVDDGLVGAVSSDASAVALAGATERALALAAEPATPARCVAHAATWSWEDEVGPAHEHLYREMLGAERPSPGQADGRARVVQSSEHEVRAR
jgi:glycosyltransferase involved in cell wall biosynthesis